MIIETPQGQVRTVTLTEETFDMMLESLPDRQKTLSARADRERQELDKWVEENIERLQEKAEGAQGQGAEKDLEIATLKGQVEELGRVIATMREISGNGQEIE